MTGAGDKEFRPMRVQKLKRRLIVMPRWGSRNIVEVETIVTLPRITLIDGPAEEEGAVG